MRDHFPFSLAVASLVFLPAHARASNSLDSSRVTIPYTSEPISINGDLSEWTSAVSISWHDTVKRGEKENAATAKLLWDADRLYVAFVVTDTDLRGDKLRDQEKLWLDDAVEVFLDTRNDSHLGLSMDEARFLSLGGQYRDENRVFLDENDYHVVINVLGSHVLAHGNGLASRGVAVAADMSHAVRFKGTINDSRDTDSGYVVEMAIPWKSVRLRAHNGLRIGAEFSIEDANGADRHASGWIDLEPFAQPYLWGTLELMGGPPDKARNAAPVIWLTLALLAFSVSGLIWSTRLRKKPPAAVSVDSLAQTRARQAAADVEQYIRERFASSDASIAEAARRNSVSPRTLQMMLKQAGKPAFRDMLAAYRFQRAEDLLRGTTRSVGEIAYAVGFNNPNVFSTAYRKHTGHSPRDLRKADIQNRS